MSADRDIERLLDTWLADGPMQVSDRAFDEAVGRVHRQRQRPAWRLLWKEPHMSPLKVALGAAAIIVVFVAGFAVLGRPGGLVGGNPLPTATLSPSPSPAASPIPFAAGALEPGRYRLDPFSTDGLLVDADLPAGWEGFPTWALISPAGVGSPSGLGMGILKADGIFSDPCHWDVAGNGLNSQPGDVTVGPTVDDLVNALRANTSYATSTPVPVTVGGYAGQKLVVQAPPDVDPASCDMESGEGRYFVFSGADAGLNSQGQANRWTISIVDAGGTRVIVVVIDYVGTSDATVAAAQAVIDSMVITP